MLWRTIGLSNWKKGIKINKRERNVLFNDALNTFYLRLYGVRHMVKDHSDSEKGNLLPPHRLLFYMHHPTDRITHTMAFVTTVVELNNSIILKSLMIYHHQKYISKTSYHINILKIYISFISLNTWVKCISNTLIIFKGII